MLAIKKGKGGRGTTGRYDPKQVSNSFLKSKEMRPSEAQDLLLGLSCAVWEDIKRKIKKENQKRRGKKRGHVLEGISVKNAEDETGLRKGILL